MKSDDDNVKIERIVGSPSAAAGGGETTAAVPQHATVVKAGVKDDSSEDLESLQLSFDDLDDLNDNVSCEDDSSNANNLRVVVMDGSLDPKENEFMAATANEQSSSYSSSSSVNLSEYIFGSLVVRIVAARGLKKTKKGHLLKPQGRRRIFQRVQSYTVANVSFGNPNEVLRTSCVEETVNPTWARSEYSMLFDISLPVPHLTQESLPWSDMNKTGGFLEFEPASVKSLREPSPLRKKPILTISVFHTEHGSNGKGNGKKKSQDPENDHDELVGISTLDVTPVITGKVSCIDKWLPLDDGMDDTTSKSGSVRVIVEYDCTSLQPRIADKVRFNGFIDPALNPLPKSQIFRVEEVVGDDVVLSYITAVERWKCTFQVHRFMLISVERYVSAVERYQDELITLTTRIVHSPAADVVSETMRSLPEEGILFVGMQAAFGGMALFDRWKKNGLSSAVDDVIYATNFDGQHTPNDIDDDRWSVEDDADGSVISLNDETSSLNSSTDAEYSIASGMPCCPITGQPMRRPVVAADGNTYERSAIRRWLRSSDTSPLTGTVLKHKDLIPNYMLITSLQNGKQNEENSQVSQF